MSLETLREEFEKTAYEEYKNDVLRSNLGGDVIIPLHPDQLFVMKPNGQYAEEGMEFAFMGYRWGVRDILEAIRQKEYEEGR